MGYNGILKTGIALLAAGLLATACGEDEPKTQPFGGESDIKLANELWSEIQGYDQWKGIKGNADFQASAAPHGNFAKIFINDTGAADEATLPFGTIVVKENHMSNSSTSTPAAITVMKRIEGYSPGQYDWFYAKFSPDGTIDANAADIKLAGEVGLGGTMGCIPCHAGAAPDYIFKN